MQEKLVIVPKKTTGGHKAGMIAFFVLTCLCLVLSMFVSPVMFLVPTIIFGVIWYLFAFRSEVEYEYTYYDGDLRFAKIRNKAKRKKIAYLSMDDVLTIAPKGDRSIYKYENDRSVTVKTLRPAMQMQNFMRQSARAKTVSQDMSLSRMRTC